MFGQLLIHQADKVPEIFEELVGFLSLFVALGEHEEVTGGLVSANQLLLTRTDLHNISIRLLEELFYLDAKDDL